MSLRFVGVTAAEKELNDVVGAVTQSLVVVGVAAIKNELEDVAEKAAAYLAELTRLREELIISAIQDYESQLRERDRDSFQKFMNFYEQWLREPDRDVFQKFMNT